MKHYQEERRAVGVALGTETGAKVPVSRTRGTSKYSDIDVEAALLAVVMAGGVVSRASELTGIPAATLAKWANVDHNQRYSELRASKGPELEKLAVEGLLEFVHAAEEVKKLALERTVEQLNSNPKDAGAVLRNVATAQGITVTKIMELSGRPTSIVMHRSPRELMAKLVAMGAVVDAEATAEEIPQAAIMPGNIVAAQADSTEAGDTN